MRSSPSRSRDLEAVRRDYGRLADDYERRWRTFNAAVFEWVLARWPKNLSAGARVLDLGCGTGAFLAAVADREPALELVGLDLTPALLAQARRRAPTARLIEGDAEAPPFKEGVFDVVCSLNVLHHLRDQKGHAAKLARLCRPRGTIFLCTFAGGRSLAMRAANAWLSLRNAAWRGMVSPAKLEQSLTRVPYVEVRDRDELSAGAWRLQLFCLALREPPARR